MRRNPLQVASRIFGECFVAPLLSVLFAVVVTLPASAGSGGGGGGGDDPWALPGVVVHELPGRSAGRGVSWYLTGRPLRAAPSPACRPSGATPGLPATRAWIDVVDLAAVQEPSGGQCVWLLDAGIDARGRLIDGGPKLVALSPLTEGVVDAWYFDLRRELSPQSRLSAVLFDATHRFALVHDAGRAGLVVIDLHARRSHTALLGEVAADAALSLTEEPGALTIRTPGSGGVRQIPLTLLLDRGLPDAVRRFAAEDAAAESTEMEAVEAQNEEAESVESVEAGGGGDSGGVAMFESQVLHAGARWLRVMVWRAAGARPAWTRLATESARLHQGAVWSAWRDAWRRI